MEMCVRYREHTEETLNLVYETGLPRSTGIKLNLAE